MFHPGIESRLGEILAIMVRYDTAKRAWDGAHCIRFTVAKALTFNHLGSSANGEQSKRGESPHCDREIKRRGNYSGQVKEVSKTPRQCNIDTCWSKETQPNVN